MGKWKAKQDHLNKRLKKDPVAAIFFYIEPFKYKVQNCFKLIDALY